VADWLPSRRALLWMLLAFVAGLVVFALVLSRSDDGFYRAGPAAPTANGPDYAPLPTPLPAGERDASGMLRSPVDDRSRAGASTQCPRDIGHPPGAHRRTHARPALPAPGPAPR